MYMIRTTSLEPYRLGAIGMNFGTRLRWARKRKKLSQSELGQRVNVSHATINRYERGINEPSFDMVQKLADALDVSVEFLLGIEREEGSSHVPMTDEELEILETIMANPDLRLMFRDLRSAPEQRIRDLITLWRILNRNQGAPKSDEKGEKR